MIKCQVQRRLEGFCRLSAPLESRRIEPSMKDEGDLNMEMLKQ